MGTTSEWGFLYGNQPKRWRINATVRATREASPDTLLTLSQQRLRALMDEGVTTVEIKSGYGLDFINEENSYA